MGAGDHQLLADDEGVGVGELVGLDDLFDGDVVVEGYGAEEVAVLDDVLAGGAAGGRGGVGGDGRLGCAERGGGGFFDVEGAVAAAAGRDQE